MMRLDESSLETAEPYHIPGYCGYCPQFKYKIKETFGKTTHHLLTAPGISRSERPVLAPLESITTDTKYGVDRQAQLSLSRGKNLGDQKYGTVMVPGYTGYIPKGQHHFGDRYAVFSKNAISRMEEDQQKYNQQQQRLRNIIHSQQGKKLKPLIEKTRMYFPKGIQHSLSPYTFPNDDPRKYMMSGYTGFVPRSRGIIGMGYPNVTNQALCDFTNVFSETKNLSKAPVILKRPDEVYINSKPIYYKDSGIVPHYTGHVPGEKFRYGRTFGHSTTNAVLKMANCCN